MTSVCSVQGVSRSILHVRHHRSGHWQDSRRSRTPTPDELLLADLRRHIAEAIAACGLPPAVRVEALTLTDFAALADALSNL